jgi:hypothetical protein
MSTIDTPTVCWQDPNRAQAKQGFDVWLYLAYCCILLSYVNINVLVFRFWLILSSVFFMVWGFVPARSVQVETEVYNILFIIINIVQMIPLARQVWPVSLTAFEEEIYQRDFHMQMNKRQFKRFIERFKTQNYRADKSQLCMYNSNFEHLIYIAKLAPGYKVCLYDKDSIKVQELEEGSWIGTIEYVLHQKKIEKNKNKSSFWDITACLEQIKDYQNTNYQNTDADGKLIAINDNNDNEDSGCTVYLFDLKVSSICKQLDNR